MQIQKNTDTNTHRCYLLRRRKDPETDIGHEVEERERYRKRYTRTKGNGTCNFKPLSSDKERHLSWHSALEISRHDNVLSGQEQRRLKAWTNWSRAQGLGGHNRGFSRSRLSFSKITIRIISTVKCYFRLYSLKSWEFRTMGQLTTSDDRRPCIDQGLSPYTIIIHSVKRRQSIQPVFV
ncbi:hypothetical protein TNCV_3772471 [Trichonephila clavipes]|nr:hypothetical protein TNCV_3772471 [Trichonephila clavipes]